MLKGQVFSKQVFNSEIFALCINTVTNGKNGVSNNFLNGMALSYSGSNITVASGAVCIQGRFLKEDTGYTISAGTDNLYCKLVIEIDLDKENTESQFNQANYKIVKSTNNYPSLTQTNIVKNNAGIYQYELARFKTSVNGITDFQDMRTFLDFESIYDAIESEYNSLLQQLQEELNNVEDGSAYLLKNNIATLDAYVPMEGVSTFINYPQGFNKENCNVIAINIINEDEDISYNSNSVEITLTNTNINIANNNLPTNTKIKIIIMKV